MLNLGVAGEHGRPDLPRYVRRYYHIESAPMAANKRNHYIPIVLLKRFSSRSEGNKSWIWQLGGDNEAVEISVKDAAVRSYFYGRSETGLESAFKAFESRLGVVFNGLDAGGHPSDYSNDLRKLIYIQMLRTRALREQFVDTSSLMLDKLFEATTPDVLQRALQKELDQNFDKYLVNELAKYPATQIERISKQLNQPHVREQLKRAGTTFSLVILSGD